MAERDDLAALIRENVACYREDYYTQPDPDLPQVVADALAAGWVRQPRTFKLRAGKAIVTDKDGNTHELTIKPDIHTMACAVIQGGNCDCDLGG